MKTRISIANICRAFAPKYYDPKQKKFVENPHGTQNAALYIGTEMELIEEIEPILWAYIANVPEEHILMGRYEIGEEARVDEAIRILNEEAHIYLEYLPDYDIGTLESIIDEHVTTHNVGYVFFDYIHTTTELLSEFQNTAKAKMQVREDQVLSNLSTKLKDLTRKYNISIDTWTQVSGDFKNDQNRDQTIVRGAKAILDKADLGAIVSRPTQKELKLLEKVLKSKSQIGKKKPNICISVYKNRGGKYNQIKIWLYIDYDTMRVHDLFVTDYNYALQSDIKQTFIRVTEDEKINAFDNKKMKIHQKIRNNNQVADIVDDNDFSDRGFIEEVDEEMKEFSDVSYADVSSSIGAEMEEE